MGNLVTCTESQDSCSYYSNQGSSWGLTTIVGISCRCYHFLILTICLSIICCISFLLLFYQITINWLA